MGMAASQARYLALTARKTNTEYEGQQINQARTALANQSADLFNRLLEMDVPDPPQTSDYTKLQYSYSDGQNESVIDDWEQLSGVNPDYNYIVNSHYYASLYTGAMKQLSDPQVQISGNGTTIADWDTIVHNKGTLDSADSAQQTAYNTYQQTKQTEEAHISDVQNEAKTNNSAHSSISSSIYFIDSDTPTSGVTNYKLKDRADNTYEVLQYNGNIINPSNTISDETKNANAILTGVYNMLETDIMDLSTLNTYLASQGVHLSEDDVKNIKCAQSQSYYTPQQKAILNCFGLERDFVDSSNCNRIVNMSDINTILNDADSLTHLTTHTHSLSGTFLQSDDTAIKTLQSYADEIQQHKTTISTTKANYDLAYATYQMALTNYNDTVKPSYIGNSELTPIFKDDLTEEQKTELLQVVSDMKEQGIDTDILNCFDSSNEYLGGVYTFKMNGVDYYTTQANLETAYASYPANGSNNVIDTQYKMPYYNASYIDTRIEETKNALLETDGDGRFKSVRFEDDTIVYSLNTETVTDEDAYEDAMNRYIYEKEVYEKTIADINAKTSIIQQEDRTLELRLKQLDTEQNALKTEMDAVKKVIKDNVESTFKTFSD